MSNLRFQNFHASEDYRDRRPRNVPTESTGLAPTTFNARSSWTGRRVLMVRKNGEWTPIDGRFAVVKMPKLGNVNVLCHDTDCDPPKGYKIGE